MEVGLCYDMYMDETTIFRIPHYEEHWLKRSQLEVPQVELPTEVKARESKERRRELKHEMAHDARFLLFMQEVRDTSPVSQRDQIIEAFRIETYQDSLPEDFDRLQPCDWALTEYLSLRDEIGEWWAYQPPVVNGVNLWGQWKRRSSAVTGMCDLAPGWSRTMF
jgi:hypothetical protein